MIDDMTLFMELTVALTAVIIVIRGLPPSGSVNAEIKFKLNFYLTQIAQPDSNQIGRRLKTTYLATCPALFYGYYCMPETPIGQTAVIKCPFYTLRLVEEGKFAKITSKTFSKKHYQIGA